MKTPVDKQQLQDFMLGKSKGARARLVEVGIETDPGLANAAVKVPPDAFVKRLQKLFIHQQTAPSMPSDSSSPMPPGTELESDEEIAQVQSELRCRGQQNAASTSSKPEQPYQPTIRPPAAILIVCDDGQNTGEVIRLRNDRFIIGRTEGDFQLPNDDLVSSRHVAITQQSVSGQLRLVVTDLQSRNGMFVRVAKSPLAHQAEILIGGGRYRFEIIQEVGAPTAAFTDFGLHASNTRAFDGHAPVGSSILCEMISGGIGARTVLIRDQYWIGSDAECDICRADDPFVSGKHALLARSAKGTWVLQHNNTINGLWLRMPQIVLEAGKKCEFQIGEQRFRLRFGVAL